MDTEVDRCDSLLTSCLSYAAGGKVDYKMAQDAQVPGLWYRDSHHKCLASSGATKADFSRDMALGLLICLMQANDVANAKAFLAHADANGGQMAPGGDVHINAIQPLTHYLYESFIAHANSLPMPAHPGNVDPSAKAGQQLTYDLLAGSDAHLAVLGVLVDGLIHGSLLTVEKDFVEHEANRQPNNGFFQFVLHKYTDGQQDAAISLLGNQAWFPETRLPTSADRSTYFLWERDQDQKDWAPSSVTPAQTFSGTDYSWLVALMAGDVRGS